MFSEINSEKYDFPPIRDKKNILNYVIASTPRSGSTLLGKLLWDTNLAGAPHEYFHDKHSKDYFERWNITSLDEYIEYLHEYRSSANRIFGIKLHYHQLRNFNLSAIVLNKIFNYPKFIFIKRKNKVLQAISFVKALQTKQWALSTNEQLKSADYDFDQIDQALQRLVAEEQEWEVFFKTNGIEYKIIYYEDFIVDMQSGIENLVCYIGVDSRSIEVSPSIVKMANEETMQWLDRFMREKEVQCKI